MIASLTHNFNLSLNLVQRAGVDAEPFRTSLRASTRPAPTFDKKLAMELAYDYSKPNFSADDLRKDLVLIPRNARGVGAGEGGAQ